MSAIIGFIDDALDPIGWLIGNLDKLDGSSHGWIAEKGWRNWTGLSFCYW